MKIIKIFHQITRRHRHIWWRILHTICSGIQKNIRSSTSSYYRGVEFPPSNRHRSNTYHKPQ